jgi:L-ascorbate metabolism protein UlaG (beta-lactamase superfamily)
MKARWLGWAGVEIEVDGATVVIDPLADAAATFAALGDRAREMTVPSLAEPREGTAVAGLVSHLHRDHTDAAALGVALAPGASVYEPAWPGGGDVENAAIAQANWELEQAKLPRQAVGVWESFEVGPFKLTALPAVDGLGDPQVAWVVEAEGHRVVHLGDTVFHGYWWRMVRRHGPFDVVFVPINGAAVDFPHLQPPSTEPAAMVPEQAALAGEALGATTVVPLHYGGFAIDPWYRPVDDPLARFETAAADYDYEARPLEPGESFEVAATSEPAASSTG